MNADGSSQTVVPNTTSDNGSVDWSPDSATLVYSGFDTTTDQIWTINPDGTGKATLTDSSSGNFQVAWATYASADTDNDGVSNAIENAAPNSGDANNDGVLDSFQANITSVVSPLTGKYVMLQSSCDASTGVSLAGAPDAYKDAGFTYPTGLLTFTLHCASAGAAATVTQYYFGVTSGSARKYSAVAHTYQAVPGAVISQVAIGGQAAAKVLYNITDGGSLDQDGAANSVIVDPFGLGAPAVGVPNTGLGGVFHDPFRYLKKGLMLR
jgi:hypothetical protein